MKKNVFFRALPELPKPPPPHNGPKSLILAPQDIPDISGYQLGFGRRFVKAYNTENPVRNQKIL